MNYRNVKLRNVASCEVEHGRSHFMDGRAALVKLIDERVEQAIAEQKAADRAALAAELRRILETGLPPRPRHALHG